jgi:ActR/RegA family two-component response regulator
MERNLARFLVEERGFAVAAEAATAADTASAVQEHRPDVVLVHEDVAVEGGPALFDAIRSSSPRTRVVLLTTNRAAASAALVAAADAVVEEGSGLTELASALSGRPDRPVAVRAAAPIPLVASVKRSHATAKERGWIERLQGAAAASIIVLAVILARGAGTGVPAPQAEGLARVHVVAAGEVLDTLEARIAADAITDDRDLARTRGARSRSRTAPT